MRYRLISRNDPMPAGAPHCCNGCFYSSITNLFGKTMKKVKFLIIALAVLLLTSLDPLSAAARERTEIKIPDILGYKTLKCDFHMHTVFSDGNVWPPIRVDEAWLQGLDAISITDHIEYQPHDEDIKADHNRSYELARSRADELSLILVKGSEITRDMPPGHLNAIFLKDSNPLDVDDWREAVRIAHEQGALVFWNHPGWERQAPGGVAVWYAEHTELLEQGLLMGMEVANHFSYYPEVFQWAIDKNLALFGNSDSHQPIAHDYDAAKGEFRPYTLVFAEERSGESIREALLDRRSAAVYQGKIIGAPRFLEAIFDESVSMAVDKVSIRGTGGAAFQVHNSSDIDFVLENGRSGAPGISVPSSLTLKAGKTVFLPVRATSEDLSGEKAIPVTYRVANLLAAPGEGQEVTLELKVEFIPAE